MRQKGSWKGINIDRGFCPVRFSGNETQPVPQVLESLHIKIKSDKSKFFFLAPL